MNVPRADAKTAATKQSRELKEYFLRLKVENERKTRREDRVQWNADIETMVDAKVAQACRLLHE